jgi:hypothetical protein
MDESVIDRAVYAELRDTTGAEFAAELLDTFIEEGPGMLAELRAARAEGNAERFRPRSALAQDQRKVLRRSEIDGAGARVRA